MLTSTLVVNRGWGPRKGLIHPLERSGVVHHAALVLEDMAYQIADNVATAYLAEAGQGLSGAP